MIAALVELDANGLCLQWRNHLGGAPPAHLPRWLLMRILAYRIQAAAFAGLDKETLRVLRQPKGHRLASLDLHPFEARIATTREGTKLKAGALLARWVGEQPDSSFVARKLESARRLFIAGPSYLARRGAPKRLVDLEEHDLIGGGPAAPGERSWAARRNSRTEIVAVEPRVRARSATGVVACASLGLGVAVASIWMCAEELASGALTEVLTDYALNPMAAFVVFPAGRRPSRKARVFADYLEQALTQSRTSSLESASASARP